ncbi:Putative uncharacterized protein [Lactococcus lactis subsp. lactis A12]|uniref:Uncharacterized protein n=1 Tax=Lactococcus lactis subsp. lactis A12 TaxID=1137134 RepID=S6FTT4_LACLL|nr:Putative uncharacterized protein [Lactococcus lactis subsp. lactis A12]SBW30852.1 Hypothetical protein LLA12_01702 [Lactococcus lactis subsp. lactis]
MNLDDEIFVLIVHIWI